MISLFEVDPRRGVIGKNPAECRSKAGVPCDVVRCSIGMLHWGKKTSDSVRKSETNDHKMIKRGWSEVLVARRSQRRRVVSARVRLVAGVGKTDGDGEAADASMGASDSPASVD